MTGGFFQTTAPACPHGSHFANTGAHPELRRVCNICGGPRIELRAEGVSLTGAESAALMRANAAVKRRAASRVGGIFGLLATTGGALTTLLMLVLAIATSSVPFWPAAVVAILTLPCLALAAFAFSKVKQHGEAAKAALGEAWSVAVAELVRSAKRGLTARDVAGAFAIPEPEADAILIQASIEHQLRSDVTDDGLIVYTSSAPLRIDAAIAPGPAPMGPAHAGPAHAGPAQREEDAELEARFAALDAQEAAARRKSR